jgi:hypothetical protein
MNVAVNLVEAEKNLRQAVKVASAQNYKPKTNLSDLIKKVILGSHLTYRYILTNAILAKATNENCNPLTLQARSSLDGAYDARSLCHKVLVPLERELLGNRLGASNEPFLNKPARYTEMSSSNAVRRGNDLILRDTVITICGEISNHKSPFDCLLDCIFWIFQRESRNIDDFLETDTNSFMVSSIIGFSDDFLNESHEGETCAIMAGTSFSLLAELKNLEFHVKTHKTNQAGSSSNEISDIDVFLDSVLLYTAEVKDKNFSSQDVEQKGFNLIFINVLDFFKSVLTIHHSFELRSFIKILNYHAENARVKDLTFKHLLTCIKKQGW